MNLLVLAGRHDALREGLEKLGQPSPRSLLRAFGFVDNIHDLMAASDVLVTRATAQTAAEAAASGLPLVLLRPAPGVEERVADRLVAEGAAVVARDESRSRPSCSTSCAIAAGCASCTTARSSSRSRTAGPPRSTSSRS